MFNIFKKVKEIQVYCDDLTEAIYNINTRLNLYLDHPNGADIYVKVKKLYFDSKIPQYAHDGEDAGRDLIANTRTFDVAKDCWVYGTGIAMEIPKGFVGLIFPRSSNRDKNVYMPNSIGMIDSGYRGEIMVSFKPRDKSNQNEVPYNVGDKIAQIMIIPYPYVRLIITDKLSDSNRGDSGHGDSGR